MLTLSHTERVSGALASRARYIYIFPRKWKISLKGAIWTRARPGHIARANPTSELAQNEISISYSVKFPAESLPGPAVKNRRICCTQINLCIALLYLTLIGVIQAIYRSLPCIHFAYTHRSCILYTHFLPYRVCIYTLSLCFIKIYTLRLKVNFANPRALKPHAPRATAPFIHA